MKTTDTLTYEPSYDYMADSIDWILDRNIETEDIYPTIDDVELDYNGEIK